MLFIWKALFFGIKIIQMTVFERFVWVFALGENKKSTKNSSADYFRVHDDGFVFIAAGITGNHSLIYPTSSSLAESTEQNKSTKLLCLKLTTKVSGVYYFCGINYNIYNAFNEVILGIFIQ